MTLKKKYRTGKVYKGSINHTDHTGKSTRHKLSQAQKALLTPQPKKILYINPRGARKMILVSELENYVTG